MGWGIDEIQVAFLRNLLGAAQVFQRIIFGPVAFTEIQCFVFDGAALD